MERQELIRKIEQLPPDRLAEVKRFVESIASGEPELERKRIHQAIAEYAMKHAGTDFDLPLTEEYRASVKEIVEDVIEEAAFARAIDKGRDTARVAREEIFQIIEGSGKSNS
jgi:hypothetical protein